MEGCILEVMVSELKLEKGSSNENIRGAVRFVFAQPIAGCISVELGVLRAFPSEPANHAYNCLLLRYENNGLQLPLPLALKRPFVDT